MKIVKKSASFYVYGAFAPLAAHAQNIESIINHTNNYLQGPIARGLGLLAVIGAGYLCLFRQKFPKEYFMMVLLGLGMIFGSSTLYATLVG